VRFASLPRPGEWIRRRGEDIAQGASVLPAGRRLTWADLGLAASVGERELQASARPRVALLCSGSELVEPGTVAAADLPEGHIFNSNRYFLQAMLRAAGCEVSDLGAVPDEAAATRALLAQAAQGHDLVLTSGGVSVGEEDHVKPAVQALGELALWKIAMKPGKPFAFGRLRRDGGADDAPGHAWFIGLPGNPVSSYVCFALLVRPFVLALQGMAAADLAWPVQPLRADFAVPKAGKRREFLRVRRNAAGGLDLFPNQSSGVLTSLAWADGLVDLPAGQTIAAGQTVRYLSLRDLG
jgi:molybdopterin molybdotransferase